MYIQEEKKLIGYGMQNTKTGEKFLKLVSHLDFLQEEHRIIAKAIESSYKRYGVVDVATVAIETNTKTTATLDTYCLFYQIDNIPPESLARHIKDKRVKKLTQRLINKIDFTIKDDSETGVVILDRIDTATKKLREMCKITQFEYTDAQQTTLQFQDHVANIAENDLTGLPIGVPLFENNLLAKGFAKGELTVVGAIRSMGKTALMLQSFFECGKANIPVSFISTEMQPVNLMSRLALRFTDGVKLKKKNLQDEKIKERIAKFQNWYKDKNLFLEVGTNQNGLNDVNTICDYLEEMKRKRNIQGAFVDYGNRILDRFESKRAMRYFNLQEIYRKFKDRAVELDIAIVVGHQVTQKAENVDFVPTLGDLKESGGVADEADTVVFLFGNREKQKIKAKIAKQRNDEISKVFQMTFDRPRQVFYNSLNEFKITDLLKEIENE